MLFNFHARSELCPETQFAEPHTNFLLLPSLKVDTESQTLVTYSRIHDTGFPGSSAGKESTYGRRPWFDSEVEQIPWRRGRLPTPVFLGFPGDSGGKEFTCNVRDLGSISGLARSPGGGHGYPLQYSYLENPHGQRSRGTGVHGLSKNRTERATKQTQN